MEVIFTESGSKWRLAIRGTSAERDEIDKLMAKLKGDDSYVFRDSAEVKKAIKIVDPFSKPTDFRGTPKQRSDDPVGRAYTLWCRIFREKYPDALMSNTVSGEEWSNLRTMAVEYGDGLEEVFRVAVMDWAALRSRLGTSIPQLPDLRSIYWHRRELANAVTAKGLTTFKHRTSDYGGDAAYDGWRKK